LNRENFDSELVKNLDLFNYWEPLRQFRKEKVELRFHYMLRSLVRAYHETKGLSDTVEVPSTNAPILVGMDTFNQANALREFLELLGYQQFTVSFLEGKETQELEKDQLTALSLTHWREFIKGYVRFTGYDRSVHKQRWPYYFEILGKYEYIRRVLKSNMKDIRLYVGSNDHSGISQAGFVAARKLGIPSLYVQHAAVSEKFPPLKMTHAFLDGNDAKEKYLSVAPTPTKIRLVGGMRYDSYLKNPKIDRRPDLVGICFSSVLHDQVANLKLCEALAMANRPFEIRFHPAVPDKVREPFRSQGWIESDSKVETALDFIARCGTIVSGDSSILLEAVILKRLPIYFASTGEAIDYYGFVEKKVVHGPFLKWESVVDALDEDVDLTQLRENARHFNSVLGTEWEGRSRELAYKYIQEFL
jgi:hypothetical protein